MPRHIWKFVLICFVLSAPVYGQASFDWTHTWGGINSDSISSTSQDANGDVYMAGSTSSFGAGGQDALILKYDPSGNLLWARTWGGSSDDDATAVAADPYGNVYVTGGTQSFGAGWSDVFLLKFDSSGNLLWSETWGGSSYDKGHDISFDSFGNVLVAAECYSYNPPGTGYSSAAILKFSPDGTLLWNRAWEAQIPIVRGPTYDGGYSLAVDNSGNIFLSGITWDYNVSPNHDSIFVVKFDSSGNFLWNRNWAGPSEDEAWGTKTVRADAAGNVYIAGRTAAQCNSTNFGTCDFDVLVLKLDANGNFVWSKTWKASAGFDTATSFDFDPSGNLVITGTKDEFGTAAAPILLRIDPNGNLLSSLAWSGGPGAVGSAVTLDPSGDLFVAGSAPNNVGSWQSFAGTLGTENGTLTDQSSNVGIAPFSPVSQTGTITSPAGVIDTGGGGQDAFVSALPPNYSPPPPVTHTLTVASTNPSSGVAIGVSLLDNNNLSDGTTEFTRTYNAGVQVTLVAPVTASGNTFSSWTGCDSTSGSNCTVTMSADRTVTANYVIPAPPPAPTVQSVQPEFLTQGTSVTLTITGTGFQPTDAVSMGSGDISVAGTSLNAQGQLVSSATVPATAALGCRDISVINPQGQLLTTSYCGVFVVSSAPPAPGSLQVVVGDKQVFLSWHPVTTFPSITSYLVSVDVFNTQRQAYVPYGSNSVPSSQNSVLLSVLDAGQTLENGALYSFTVAGVSAAGVNGESTQAVAGEPTSFPPVSTQYGSLAPQHPVLFIHGITDPPADNYWTTARNYLQGSLGWKFGGVLKATSDGSVTLDQSTATKETDGVTPVSPGDFYTVLFSNPLANDGGIAEEGNEVGEFVNELWKPGQSFPRVSLFAHSMGGLAARAYLQNSDKFPQAQNRVEQLITYGTPHLGILADDLQNQYNEILNSTFPLSYFADPGGLLGGTGIVPRLNQHGINSDTFTSVGFEEMNGETNSEVQSSCRVYPYQFPDSQFLSALNNANNGYSELPGNLTYEFLAGQYQLTDEYLIPPSVLQDANGELLGNRNGLLCPMFQDTQTGEIYADGIVPLKSADPSGALPPAFSSVPSSQIFAKHTPRAHWEEADDIPTILCALSTNCLVAEAYSPVSLQVTDPEGRQIAENLMEVPGAAYDLLHDQPGHETTVVTIPFPIPGAYTITAVSKPGASPTDTYSISVTQNGTTQWVAQNVAVSAIPQAGYVVRPNSAPVPSISGPTNVQANSSAGAAVALVGSATDADGDPVTLRWMGTFGDVMGPTLETILPVGTNRLLLVATDSHGATGTAEDVITVTPLVPSVRFGGSVLQPLFNDGNGHFIATVTVTNQGNVTVDSAQIATASTKLGTVVATSASGPIMNLGPGASTAVTLTFPITSALSSATSVPLRITGSYSARTLSGNWGLTFRSVMLGTSIIGEN